MSWFSKELDASDRQCLSKTAESKEKESEDSRNNLDQEMD
jgi:hypothetical protein